MNREEILKEIDDAMAELRDVKEKVNEISSKLFGISNIVTKDDNEAYSKGLEDAWELAQKLWLPESSGGLHHTKVERIYEHDMYDIPQHFTVQEALAKLEAYEKEQEEIKVGDVVECLQLIENDWKDDCYGVVTSVYNDSHYEILMQNGDGVKFGRKELKKTGKHIDISSILEQIKEN